MISNWDTRFSNIAQRTHPPQISWLMAQALEVPDMISLAAGFVDQQTLPHQTVFLEMEAMMQRAGAAFSPLQYGTTAGDLDLRAGLIENLRRDGAIPSHLSPSADHLFMGSGSQQVLYLAMEALLDEGDIVLLEAPTYFVILGALQSRGAQTVGIDTDEDGLIPERLAEALAQLEQNRRLHRVKLLYLMSYSTNPQGVQLALQRRHQVIELLTRYREKGYPILLLEDAAYRHLCFDRSDLPPLYSLQPDDEMVLYTESFSKSLSPGLRLGFGLGPKALVQKMVDLKGSHDFGSSNLSIQIVKAVLQSGAFDRHTDTLRAAYRHKWKQVEQILWDAALPGVSWIPPAGGFYTWVQLPSSICTDVDSRLFQEALRQKVLYVPGNLCYSPDRMESRSSSCLRLAFGMIGEERLREGCHRLVNAIRSAVETNDGE